MSLYSVSLVFPNVRCEALLSAQPGQWAMNHIFCFIFLSDFTPAQYYPVPMLQESANQQPAQPSMDQWEALKLTFPPSRQSGDKGQKCHLSSQISSPNLYMILGNVSISKY